MFAGLRSELGFLYAFANPNFSRALDEAISSLYKKTGFVSENNRTGQMNFCPDL